MGKSHLAPVLFSQPLQDLGQARAQFHDAQKAMEQGDWIKFGDVTDKLKMLLANPVAM
jgi:hypothetical protein